MRSGKELTERAANELQSIQKAETGGNMAAFPTLIVCLGEKSLDRIRTVRRTLEDNWNNAGYLKYLFLEYEGGKWKCRDLFPEEGGQAEFPDIQEGFLRMVVALTSSGKKVFAERSRVKAEFFLNAEEENAFVYYEKYEKMKKVLNYGLLKTLFLMVDESTWKNRQSACALCRRIRTYRESGEGGSESTLYVLSNYLRGGRMLAGSQLALNDRLAADLILLGGNYKDGKWTQESGVYNGIKTAAYSLVTKPIDDITVVTLENLAKEWKKRREERAKEAKDEELLARLGISRNRIRALESYFKKNICPEFPEENALTALPFLKDSFYKKISGTSKIAWNEIDEMTGGVWKAFCERYYKGAVWKVLEREGERENCKEALYREWRDALNPFEMKRLLERDTLLNSLEGISPVVPDEGKGGFAVLDRQAREVSKRLFYQEMQPVLREVAERLRQDISYFEEAYEECRKEISAQRLRPAKDEDEMERFYSAKVREFLQEKEENWGKRLFCVENRKEEILEILLEGFSQLIREKGIYSSSFEEELKARMDMLTEEKRSRLIGNELNQQISGDGRLNCIYNYTDARTATYYLVNCKAAYYEELQRTQEQMRYKIFDMNRTDCIEKLEVYDLKQLEGTGLFDEAAEETI